jgi:uncharacterized protein
MIRIVALNRFPVKSLRGHGLPAARILTEGIARDRGWMVIGRDGVFLTQRQCPRMATLSAQLTESGICLTAANYDVLNVTFPAADARVSIRVWKDDFTALDAGDSAAQWISSRLNVPVRLVAFDPHHTRLCSKAYAKDSGAHTQFADGFPILVTNQASLDDLNARITTGANIGMDRFRANVVIDRLEAWDEDHLDTITCGGVVLQLVKPCVRCITTTTDQLTGERMGEEPLTTLARFRNNPDMGGVIFGMNAIVLATGMLRVGDPIEVTYRF